MRSRIVPVGVAASDSEHTAVAHIDGDKNLLAFMSGYCPLTQDHLIGIDIVVDGVESLRASQSGSGKQYACDQLTVTPGKLLANLNIMQIVLQVLTIEVPSISGIVLMEQGVLGSATTMPLIFV